MINLFQFSPNDASLQYLITIFGNMNGVIPAQGTVKSTVEGLSISTPGATTGGNITLLGTMFTTFNGVILTIGALMLVYITVVGVMITAHEGEFMGKKFHQIWTPIRTVLGIALLVPFNSGYSGIQILMMWVIVQGIGAADTIWATALNYIDVVGSPYAQVSSPTISVAATAQNLFKGLVCDASARFCRPNPSDIPKSGYFSYSSNASPNAGGFCSDAPQFSPTATNFSLGPGGACGALTFCKPTGDPNSLPNLACQAQLSALSTIIPTLAGIAEKVVQVDYTYRDFWQNSWRIQNNPDWQWIYDYCSKNGIDQSACCNPVTATSYTSGVQTCRAEKSLLPSPYNNGEGQMPSDQAVTALYWEFALKPIYGNTDVIGSAVNYYSSLIGTAVSTYISTRSQTASMSNDELTTAYNTGWIFAGSYYFVISQMNNGFQKDAMPDLSMFFPADLATNNIMSNYRNNLSSANGVINSVGGGSGSQLNQMGAGNVDTAIGSGVRDAGKNFSAIGKSPSTNPVLQMQQAGFAMLMIVQLMFIVILATTFGVGIAGAVSPFAAGFGIVNPVTPAATLMYFILVPALFGLLGIMTFYGGLLGVYVPLIPYFIFTFGAISWFLSVIEAMVAGPLVALGILSPSGQHELLGKAEGALMLLFAIFLRPTLMIFGLMAAILLATVVGTMVNTAFWGPVATGIARGGVEGSEAGAGAFAGNILEFIIFLGAYVALMVAALNKCFALIHLLPERVLSWIGAQTPGYGEGELAGQMRGEVAQSTGGVRGVVGKKEQAESTGKYGKAIKDKKDKGRTPDISSSGGPPA